MPEFLKKHAVFFLVFLYLFLKFGLNEVLGINEQVILPIARHFVDPSWIEGDWYLDLNSHTSYRLFFNGFAGGLSLLMPLEWVSVVGRILTYGFFAWFMQRFALLYGVKTVFLIPFLWMFTNNQTLEAGEWIIRGFETKPFAYTCALLALLALMKRRYTRMFVFAGLSISFHMLIGFFAAVTMGVAVLMNHTYFKGDFIDIIKRSWIAAVTGAFGIYVVVNYFTQTSDADSLLASQIYVLFRTPHHTFPGAWEGYKHYVLLFGLLLFLLAVIWRTRNWYIRIWASYGLGAGLFFIVGLLFYFAGSIKMLKFYWFRFPDTIIPFFFLMTLAILVSQIYTTGSWRLHQAPEGRKKEIAEPILVTLRRVFFLATVIILVFTAKAFVEDCHKLANSTNYSFIDSRDPELNEAMVWIRQHTETDAQFLVSPYIRNFYLVAERPMFVSLKHFLQKDDHIIEWFDRLTICNNNEALPMRSVFQMRAYLEKNFYNLPVEQLKKLNDVYDMEYYLHKGPQRIDLPVAYRNADYTLYRIIDD